jgi:NAD(P)H-hydrate epimerase
MQILTSPMQMQLVDRAATRRFRIPGIVLMENAGRAFVDHLEKAVHGVEGKSVVVVCGKGNNGGDGFVIARHLLNRGASVSVVLLTRKAAIRNDAAAHLKILLAFAPHVPDRLVIRESPGSFRSPSAGNPDIIVDAIFGTGFDGIPSGVYTSAITWINRQRAFVASVDIPSGVHGATGDAEGAAVRADLTVTMGAAKIGHFLGKGSELSGRVEVVDIGLPHIPVKSAEKPLCLVEEKDIFSLLPRRPRNAHKYSVGKVFVLGGSRQFTGAPALAAQAALRSGAGAVVLGVPSSIHPVLSRKLNEVIVQGLDETPDGTLSSGSHDAIASRLSWADAVVLGPGLGRNPETDRLLLDLYRTCPRPMVIDADALTAIASLAKPALRRAGPAILTPHAGEMGRLLGKDSAEVERTRLDCALEAARKFHAVVVLKGAPTITCSPAGERVLNATGNPGMATIGTGDVLAGLIAGLVAQGLPPFEAAYAGVFLHGRAGDFAAEQYGERSLLASDVLNNVSRAVKTIEGS